MITARRVLLTYVEAPQQADNVVRRFLAGPEETSACFFRLFFFRLTVLILKTNR